MRFPTPLPGVLACGLILASASPLSSASGEEFLPPEQAFAYLVESDGRSLKVQWNVAPGYYLYKSRMALTSTTSGVTVGEPSYPEGESHHDEYFGDQEIFRDDFVVTAPLAVEGTQARELTVQIRWQGCADAGLCYPPTTWEAKVTLPAQ